MSRTRTLVSHAPATSAEAEAETRHEAGLQATDTGDSMPRAIAAPTDAALRRALRGRTESLRHIETATGIRFTTLAAYEAGEGSKDGQAYKTNITLVQAEKLARYFGLRLKLVK